MSNPSQNENQPLRIGLVGAGKMAQHHARAITRVAGASLVAVVDRDESALNAMRTIAPQILTGDSLSELARSAELDIVHIVTPPETHASLAREALEAGLHVYVEKPFAPTLKETQELLALAQRRGLKVCAGHQLLFEKPARLALELLPSLGRLVHVESYFSFRTVRRIPGGRAPLRADLQLLDILPHPVYVLLHFLERQPGATELTALNVGERGTVNGLVRHGDVVGTLIVTLEGRPVESYLRLVGTNGSIFADFVRGTVQRHIGPGTSGIDKLLAPYRQAWQTWWGTTGAMARRFLKRQRSYPGLQEIFESFYQAIRTGAPSPVSPSNIEGTVRLCQKVTEALAMQRTAPAPEVTPVTGGRRVVLTGGTGFLGKMVARKLAAAGWRVRVLARRVPAAWESLPGVEYRVADLGRPLDAGLFGESELVIHAAAETAGGWVEHERNSVAATEHVLRAAAAAGVKRVIHVSSLAVLDAARVVKDDTRLLPDSRKQGPYVWGKLESERLAQNLAKELKLALRTVRPGAIVDYLDFEPPGRLGKRLGNWFVAVGSPGQRLGVVDLSFAGDAFVWMAEHFDGTPERINLLDAQLPSKRDLLSQLKKMNPDLTVVWLPTLVLIPLSWAAIALQKLLRPGRPAINAAKVFAVQRYDTSGVERLVTMMAAPAELTPQSQPLATSLPAN
jgi:predicted dehydrogenase/nucleoside-diphosphate-sugar epimerase